MFALVQINKIQNNFNLKLTIMQNYPQSPPPSTNQHHANYSNNLSLNSKSQVPIVKVFDKSMPIIPPKNHFQESFTTKTNSHNQMANFNFNPNSINKNIQFRNSHNIYQPHPPSTSNSNNPPPNSRLNRGMMSQSLMVLESDKSDKVEMPEDYQFPIKKQINIAPRRSHRMSQSILDDSSLNYQHQITIKKQDNLKELNFLKQKSEEEKIIEEKNKQYSPRPIPAFLNKIGGLQIKKTSVADPYLQNFLKSSKQLGIKAKKKISPDSFIKIKQLGNGKYGRVYLVRQKQTGFICALKVIEKKLLHEEQITDQFIRELKIQMFLNHPNIVKMYGFFDDSSRIYIILEVGTGGQLYHQLKRSQPLPQAKVAFFMKQICDAVNEIHTLRIIHRDIKPENIVIHDNIIKLCDFGWSVHQDNKLRTTFCGTPLYVCPEILKGKEYDQKIDIWSIGIMMYEMVVGENPFKITKQEELIKIVKDQIKIPTYLFVSTEVRDFLDKCLQKNPNDRSSIKQLVNHAFFKKHNDKQNDKKINDLMKNQND